MPIQLATTGRILRWLGPTATRGSFSSAVVACVLVILSAIASGPLLRLADTARIGSASGLYFETAANWVFCHRYGHSTSGDAASRARINLAEIRDRESYDRSVVELIDGGAGSVAAYCNEPSSLTQVEELGMMLIDAAAIKLAPSMSLSTLATTFAVSRLVLLWLFAWSLIQCGYSVPIVGAATGCAVYLTMLLGGNALYATYPFILPVTLAGVALCGWSLESKKWMPAVAILIGLWVVFLGNLRTSHYPIALALAVLLFIRVARSEPRARTAACIVVCALVILVSQRMLTLPFADLRTAHTISHPLVLGLANPPSDLSRREGIEWNDANGVVLARRIDSGVVLSGPGYEDALWRYYMSLWKKYPSEMTGIYVRKLFDATESVFNFLSQRGERPGTVPFWNSKSGRFLTLSAFSIRWLSRLLTLGVVLAGMALIGWWLPPSFGVRKAWVLLAVGVAGMLAFLEAAVILGSVTLWYDGVLIFAATFAGLMVIEGALTYLTQRVLSL